MDSMEEHHCHLTLLIGITSPIPIVKRDSTLQSSLVLVLNKDVGRCDRGNIESLLFWPEV